MNCACSAAVQIAHPTDVGLASEIADRAVAEPPGLDDLLVEFGIGQHPLDQLAPQRRQVGPDLRVLVNDEDLRRHLHDGRPVGRPHRQVAGVVGFLVAVEHDRGRQFGLVDVDIVAMGRADVRNGADHHEQPRQDVLANVNQRSPPSTETAPRRNPRRSDCPAPAPRARSSSGR